MDFLTFFVVVCMINSALYFIDTIFKTCSHYPYIRFLHGTGLNIGFFRITWFTRAFNRSFQRCTSFRTKVLEQWFNMGVFVAVALLPISLIILLLSIGNILKAESISGEDVGLVLEPLIPGINLPVSDFGYYVLTIAVSSIIHELGHVMAALREDVHIAGVGLMAVFIIPMAFVKINSEHLSVLSPVKQLRIFCAGIWHNIALALLAYLFLVMIPVLFSPVYDLGRGVVVLDVHRNSQIAGKTGIDIGDKLVAINDCEVSGVDNWLQCLKSFNHKPVPGFCVNEDIIHQLDQSIPLKLSENGVVQCCDESSESHLCFETLDNGAPLQILQYSCLPGRPVIAGTAYMCSTPKDCPPSLHCVRPVTPQGTTLLRIQRSHGDVVIFIGKPNHVLATVHVSDFIQIFDIFTPELAEGLTRLTKYFVLFSSGLALINSMPCFYFDGNHVTHSLVSYFLQERFRYKNLIALSLIVTGTALLVINFSCLMWKSLIKNF